MLKELEDDTCTNESDHERKIRSTMLKHSKSFKVIGEKL